ncbi:MAG TPA: damage-inducible protein D [Verrucomicrobiae bacterium]|nr:damage-inducible protein D [Verrucomicrobiae bacterium]
MDPSLTPATQPNPFHLEPDKPGFEDMGESNGFRFWWASDLARLLGYSSTDAFRPAVNKAMAVCAQLNIDISENILQVRRDVDGHEVRDFKLSRFACYLSAMNGDPKKAEVARAQAYFAAFAGAVQQYVERTEAIDRVHIRGELSDRERTLSGVAKTHGVTNYAFFQNAGYRGLYNMDLRRLRLLKGVADGRSLLDFMGREELAANLFRITQTEAKIRKETITGQRPLEAAAESVGREVRRTIQKVGGTVPEQLAAEKDIRDVQKNIKDTHRQLKRLDSPKAKRTVSKSRTG